VRKKIKNILREKNEFEWMENITPLTKAQISHPLNFLKQYGFYFHNIDKNSFINYIYEMGLNQTQLNILRNALSYLSNDIHDYGMEEGQQNGWEEGHSDGYDEGHDEGYDEGRRDCEDEKEEKYDEGYEEGHERGYEDSQEYSLNKFKEERKTIYNKAFEEGRAYESELDSEEFEKRQSGYDPRDYDGDYEN